VRFLYAVTLGRETLDLMASVPHMKRPRAEVYARSEVEAILTALRQPLSQCDPTVANGIDLSLLERRSPIEWDNVVLYGQYILDRKLVRRCHPPKRAAS